MCKIDILLITHTNYYVNLYIILLLVIRQNKPLQHKEDNIMSYRVFDNTDKTEKIVRLAEKNLQAGQEVDVVFRTGTTHEIHQVTIQSSLL